jgi:hypothetical protein
MNLTDLVSLEGRWIESHLIGSILVANNTWGCVAKFFLYSQDDSFGTQSVP